MQKWLNAADTVIEMMIKHLPSPVEAQNYRYRVLYDGDLNDPAALSIKKCDSEGPLIVFVSKMLPT